MAGPVHWPPTARRTSRQGCQATNWKGVTEGSMRPEGSVGVLPTARGSVERRGAPEKPKTAERSLVGKRALAEGPAVGYGPFRNGPRARGRSRWGRCPRQCCRAAGERVGGGRECTSRSGYSPNAVPAVPSDGKRYRPLNSVGHGVIPLNAQPASRRARRSTRMLGSGRKAHHAAKSYPAPSIGGQRCNHIDRVDA